MLCPLFVHIMKIMLFILNTSVHTPMGARSSSAGWVVTQRRCLNGSTIPVQGPTLDAKLAARVYCIVSSPVLRQSQPDSGENCIVLQSWPTRSLVAKFLQCSVVAWSTQIWKEHCKQGHGQVCANLWCLMSWHPKCIRTIAAMWAHLTYLRIHYARI